MRNVGFLALVLLFPFVVFASTVNINTADAALLDTLPGIGPSKAAAIVDYRTKNGLFATIEDIQKVSGIGPVTFANMKELITVSVTSSIGEQPLPPIKSLNTVQAVTPASPIINQEVNIQQNEEAVIAPAATTELVAAGAALPIIPKKSNGIFSSPWTLGLLGVILIAGVVFIFI